MLQFLETKQASGGAWPEATGGGNGGGSVGGSSGVAGGARGGPGGGSGPSSEFGLRGAESLRRTSAVVTVGPDAPLADAIIAMASHHIHRRVYICDADGRPVSIVTITDVLQVLLLGWPPPAAGL